MDKAISSMMVMACHVELYWLANAYAGFITICDETFLGTNHSHNFGYV